MPLAFPSHQGLIAPLWRRWPDHFNVLALCIGAAVPDAVDCVAGIFRGHLGQWLGHTLLGLFALCLPSGVLLTWLAVALGRWLAVRGKAKACAPRWVGRFGEQVELLNNVPSAGSPMRRIAFVGFSVWIGAVSHLFFDFSSHGNSFWFSPWYENPRFFPSWWYVSWLGIRVPGYVDPYPVGPHFVVWSLLSLLGIVMLLRGWGRARRGRAACGR